VTADPLAATQPKVERVGRYPDGIRRLRNIDEIAAIGKRLSGPTAVDAKKPDGSTILL
jgi:hypothetical protein